MIADRTSQDADPKRTRRVSFLMREDDYRIVKATATASDLNVSDAIRVAIRKTYITESLPVDPLATRVTRQVTTGA